MSEYTPVSLCVDEMNGKDPTGGAANAPGSDEPDPQVTVGTNYLTVDGTGAHKRNSVHIERPIYNQSQFDEGYHGQLRHVKTAKERLIGLKNKCACTPKKALNTFLGFLPFINIMRKYRPKRDLFGDCVAGVTVGIMQIPQGMAYAMLANVPAVVGLYVSFFPSIFYFFLGTSRQMSLGTFAVVDLMIGAAVDKQCGNLVSPSPAPPNITGNSSNFEPIGDLYFTDIEKCQIGVATCVTFVAGLIQIGMGLLQLGFITTYLSEPLTRGFTTGCACHVFTSQVKSVFGIPSIPNYQGAGKLVKTYIAIIKSLFQTNVASLIVSAICIVVLVGVKEFINPIVKRKLKMPFPIELIVVILGTVASYFLKFNDKYGLKVVGNIPSGIPPPQVPDLSQASATITDSVVIAIVAFAISVSMAKLFAKRNNYEIDANQELYAYGITNVGSSFFNCFLAACSLSRSVVQEEVGGVTQVASLVAAGLIVIVLYFISQLFKELPTCVLAAIILVALKGMFKQLGDLKRLWKVSKIDMLIWLVAFLATALLDVDLGLMVGVGFCLLSVVFRTQRPHVCVLGWVPQTDLYKDVQVYPVAKEIPGIKIIRMEASLYYANSEYFIGKLQSKTLDPKKLVLKRKKREKAALKLQKKMEREMKDPSGESGFDRSLESTDEGSTFDNPYSDTPIKHIIIDCTTMGYLDSVGVGTLLQIVSEYKQAEINVYLAGCKAGVREMLEKCEFYDKTDKAILFLTVHDAVLGALEAQPELLAKPTKDKAKCDPKTSFTNLHGSANVADDVCDGRGYLSLNTHKGTNRKGPYHQIKALFYKVESSIHRHRLDSEPDHTPLLNNSEIDDILRSLPEIKSTVYVVDTSGSSTQM